MVFCRNFTIFERASINCCLFGVLLEGQALLRKVTTAVSDESSTIIRVCSTTFKYEWNCVATRAWQAWGSSCVSSGPPRTAA